jgi:large subunit ribosomal protein L7/L12
LKEAKSLVESAPTICLKGLKTEEAEEAKKKLVEVGAEIELV